jgi:hypothetical protein
MKNCYLVIVQGKKKQWPQKIWMSPEEAVNMDIDGVDVALFIRPLPSWMYAIKDFCVDVFNFRNPMR